MILLMLINMLIWKLKLKLKYGMGRQIEPCQKINEKSLCYNNNKKKWFCKTKAKLEVHPPPSNTINDLLPQYD